MNTYAYTVKTTKNDLIAIVECDTYLKALENISSEFKHVKPLFSNGKAFNYGKYIAVDKINNRKVIIHLN